MKTNQFSVPLIALALVVLSCSKDSTPAVSPATAKSTFSSVNDDVATAIAGLSSAPGNVALNTFSSINNTVSPFGRVRSLGSLSKPSDVKAAMSAGLASIRMMLLKSTASKRISGSNAFNFNDKIGTYTWSKANHKWDYTSGGSIIKIDYPSDTTSSTNDTELQITAYTETLVGTDYFPTDIEAAIFTPLTPTPSKQLGLSLTAGGYDDSGNPNKASISLFINPYTISLSFDDSKTNVTTESFSFSKGSTTYIGTSATAVYASAADQAAGNPSKVTGYIQLESVKFDITIDGTKAATSNDANDFTVINVTVNGGTAGHVVWVTNPQTGAQEAYVQYNDGTKDKLDTLFSSLETQLNSLG
jgi:hypothetical protein